MERLIGSAGAQAPLHHSLGKAAEDIGDVDRAFDHYSKAAELSRRDWRGPNASQFSAAADQIIGAYVPAAIEGLDPSNADCRSLFVTGMPRSGTTLVEQILLGHSAVGDGAEVN